MIGYHVTTSKKYKRYQDTGGILPPVRFWRTIDTARAWAKKTKRDLILIINVDDNLAHPLPDHQPRGMAWWADQIVHIGDINDTQPAKES